MRRLLVLSLVLIGLIGGSRPTTARPSAALPPISWQTEAVLPAPLIQNLNPHSLQFDAAGAPHIAFGGDHLYYASQPAAGGSWTMQTVDSAPQVGDNAALAFDDAGRPHIAYYDRQTPAIKYAHFDGAQWLVSQVIITTTERIALAVGHDGLPRLAFNKQFARWDGTQWLIAPFTDSSDPQPSLALDSQDRPHLAVKRGAMLIYATLGATTWVTQAVDTSSYVLDSPIIALDHLERPHFAYHVYTVGSCPSCGGYYLKHSWWDGTAWQRQVQFSHSSLTAMALDALGQAHITALETQLYGNNDGSIVYTHVVSGTLVGPDRIATTGLERRQTSIAVGLDNQPAVAYVDTLTGQLTLLRSTSAGWRSEAIALSSAPGAGVSMVLDAAGKPLLSSIDGATFAGVLNSVGPGGWERRVIARPENQRVRANSIVLDPNGIAHILYGITYWQFTTGFYQESGRAVEATVTDTVTLETIESCWRPITSISGAVNGFDQVQASYVCEDNLRHSYQPDAWLSGTVSAGRYSSPSLAVDRHNLPGISSYVDGSVLYTYWPGSGPWLSEPVASGLSADPHAALAYDSLSQPHIAYYDDAQRALMYAVRTPSGWQQQAVDVGHAAGGALALVLDTQDQPHLAYTDAAVGGIKYARWDGTAWDIQTVDQVGRGASSVDLALDNAGLPHLAYYDAALADLKYAVGTPAVLSPASWLPLG